MGFSLHGLVTFPWLRENTYYLNSNEERFNLAYLVHVWVAVGRKTDVGMWQHKHVWFMATGTQAKKQSQTEQDKTARHPLRHALPVH